MDLNINEMSAGVARETALNTLISNESLNYMALVNSVVNQHGFFIHH